jgi:hypothetical protein
MFKRFFSFIFIISFLSVGFCFAFDSSSIKTIWDDCVPKISEYWGLTLTWIDNDMKPWIEKNIGVKTRQEFEREFSEAVTEVPNTVKSLWNEVKKVFN